MIANRYPMLTAIKYDLEHSRACFMRYLIVLTSSPSPSFLISYSKCFLLSDFKKSNLRHSETKIPGITMSPNPNKPNCGLAGSV